MATVTALGNVPGPILEGNSSAVSWPAILAGAAAAAALSLILLVLGTGLGLAVVSPWAGSGVSAEAISWSTILWIAFTAFAASGLGGYIAGRLRVKWPSVHTDEVYFRDTAHGFLAWAVATLLTAAVLTSVVGKLLSVGAAGGAAVAAAGVSAAVAQAGDSPISSQHDGSNDTSLTYAIDSLFRQQTVTPQRDATQPGYAGTGQNYPRGADGDTALAGAKREVSGIFENSIAAGPLSVEDQQYAAQLLSQRTGISQQEAETRVTAAFGTAQKKLQDAEAKAKAIADLARKNAAYASLWIFVSLLLGAFSASLMATYGGRRRDLY